MLTAYINYPNPHITIHADAGCSAIGQQNKPGQRRVSVNRGSLSAELERFSSKHYRFGSDRETNDMWLVADLSDVEFERAVIEHVRKLLAVHYSPFGRISISEHCT